MAKILIVEDDEMLVRMYTKKFENEGFQVVSAYSGGEGQVAAEKEKPDAMLLDIMMPCMDGFSLVRALKEKEATKNIPIVIFTNLGTSELFVNEAKQLGVQDYLVKYKTSAKEVVETIKKYIDK